MKLRKTSDGRWQGGKIGLKIRRTENGCWESNETLMDELMNPLHDLPEFDASSSSDEEFFGVKKPAKKKVFRKKKM